MSNGTFYIMTDQNASEFPEVRKMISKPLYAFNTPENIAAREPSPLDMDFISKVNAIGRWGEGENQRVWTVEGNTVHSYFVALD
jgi:hypothetical protein